MNIYMLSAFCTLDVHPSALKQQTTVLHHIVVRANALNSHFEFVIWWICVCFFFKYIMLLREWGVGEIGE